MCHLCGQQYGSASLLIHVEKCEEKWVAREETKLPKERRPVPPRPAELSAPLPTKPADVDAFNEAMSRHFNDVSLIRCPGCNRTFNEEALEKHRKACTGGAGAKAASQGGDGLSNPGGFGKGPKAFTCYCCGSQFMAGSLMIHIEQCEEKRRQAEDAKHPSERRPLPPRPAEYAQPLPSKADEVEAFNNAMQAVYNQVTKVPCACGRTFKDAETLARHAKTCPAAASTPAAPSGRDSASLSSSMAGLSVKGGAGKAGATGSGTTTADGDGGARAGSGSRAPLSYVCYLCGRQFGSASLLMHVDKCVEKWRATEATKPQGSRRQPPPRPAELDAPLPKGGAAVEAFNDTMSRIYNDASLIRCPTCNRTFTEEALQRHARSCAAKA